MALIAQATRAAGGELAMLDEEDLSGLQSALDEAKQKLQEPQDEANAARDRLSELNAELAREQGDTDTADQLELELAKRAAEEGCRALFISDVHERRLNEAVEALRCLAESLEQADLEIPKNDEHVLIYEHVIACEAIGAMDLSLLGKVL